MTAIMQKHLVLSSENCMRSLTALSGWKVQKVELTCNRPQPFPALLKHTVTGTKAQILPILRTKGHW